MCFAVSILSTFRPDASSGHRLREPHARPSRLNQAQRSIDSAHGIGGRSPIEKIRKGVVDALFADYLWLAASALFPTHGDVKMLSNQIAEFLKTSRKALGLTQKEVASRAGVSTRLWAEVERAERPNVSLLTALRMLGHVGISIRMTDASGITRELRDPDTAAIGRLARAAARRATWHGRQLRLDRDGAGDPPSPRGSDGVDAVALVSEQAFAVARSRPSAETERTLLPATRAPSREPGIAPTRQSPGRRR